MNFSLSSDMLIFTLKDLCSPYFAPFLHLFYPFTFHFIKYLSYSYFSFASPPHSCFSSKRPRLIFPLLCAGWGGGGICPGRFWVCTDSGHISVWTDCTRLARLSGQHIWVKGRLQNSCKFLQSPPSLPRVPVRRTEILRSDKPTKEPAEPHISKRFPKFSRAQIFSYK
jgi:hypothetical protein